MMDRQTTALALSTVALVPTIYGACLPPISNVRGTNDDAGHIAVTEKYAVVTASTVVLGIGLVTRTPEVIMVGGLAVIAFHLAYTNARKARA